MTTPLILKLRAHGDLTAEEETRIEDAIVGAHDVQAGRNIVEEGEHPTRASLVLDGFAARFNRTSDGKRQITAIHIPGDFVDLHGLLLRGLDHGVVALSRCKVGCFPQEHFEEFVRSYPRISRLLWLNSVIDGATHRQWVVAMGRRSALERFARLLCELYVRMRVIQKTDGMRFSLPLTQAVLGDALGLSTVHTNRVLQELRHEEVIAWQGDLITIKDWPRLKKIAEFKPAYLNVEE